MESMSRFMVSFLDQLYKLSANWKYRIGTRHFRERSSQPRGSYSIHRDASPVFIEPPKGSEGGRGSRKKDDRKWRADKGHWRESEYR